MARDLWRDRRVLIQTVAKTEETWVEYWLTVTRLYRATHTVGKHKNKESQF